MALGYRHMHGLRVPRSCQSAVLYYNPLAEQVVELARYPGSLPAVRAALGAMTHRPLPESSPRVPHQTLQHKLQRKCSVDAFSRQQHNCSWGHSDNDPCSEAVPCPWPKFSALVSTDDAPSLNPPGQVSQSVQLSRAASVTSWARTQVERVRLSSKAVVNSRRSREQEVLHYRWFADLGNSDAARALGQMLSHGALRDPEQALRYFRCAAQTSKPELNPSFNPAGYASGIAADARVLSWPSFATVRPSSAQGKFYSVIAATRHSVVMAKARVMGRVRCGMSQRQVWVHSWVLDGVLVRHWVYFQVPARSSSQRVETTASLQQERRTKHRTEV